MQDIIKLCEQGKFEKALGLIEDSITHGDKSTEIFRLKGKCEMMIGDNEKAINSLIEALKLDNSNENALLLIGNIYYTKMNDQETAMAYFEKVLAFNTKNYIGVNNIAGIVAKNGAYEKALQIFDRALTIKEGYSNALYG